MPIVEVVTEYHKSRT